MVFQYSIIIMTIFFSLLYASDHEALTDTVSNSQQELLSQCTACHGENGISSKDTASIPILAGQYSGYLAKQLYNFAKGEQGARPSALMEAYAASLSETEVNYLSEYYSKLEKAKSESPLRSDLEKGRRIFLGGVFEKKIPACSSCHSPTGFGNEPAGYPLIAGQHAEYLIAQLQQYRSFSRKHVMMNAIAAQLSDQEIEAVSYYLQGLRSKNVP